MKWNRKAAHIRRAAVTLVVLGGCLLPLSAQEPKPGATLRGHDGAIASLSFSPDGKTLASGSEHRSVVKLWDVTTGKNAVTLKEEDPYLWSSVAFSPDGKSLASGGWFNKIKLWDVATRRGTILLDQMRQNPPPRVAFSPDGKTLVSFGMCVRDIRLWDMGAGKYTFILKGHDAYGVCAIVFSPDGKFLTAMGIHHGIKRWEVATGRITATLEMDDSVHSAAFTPDGKILATACNDKIVEEGGRNVVKETGRVKLWDAATAKERATLKGHTDIVRSLVFSPDGKTLATGSADNSIKLWDLAKGKELGTLKGHSRPVGALAYSPDGKTLASGSVDKTIKLWDAERGGVKIGLVGPFQPGKLVTVNATIQYPLLGQSVTLELPPGLQRVEGMVVQPVPLADAPNAFVQWKVRVLRPGRFQVRVHSSTGATDAKLIEVKSRILEH